MTNLKHITYVIDPTTMAQYSAVEMRDLCTANQATNSTVRTVCELFPLLSNPNFTTDLIAIDINQCYLNAGISIFDITNTLNTLIKSTVSRAGSDRPLRRTTKIFFIVNCDTDASAIKEVISTDIIGILVLDSTVPFEEKQFAIAEFLEGRTYIPKRVNDLVKGHKVKPNSKNSIDLTPREQQILSLIQDRGISNKVIARILDISESTVKLHLGKVLKKFGLRTRTQLALFANN